MSPEDMDVSINFWDDCSSLDCPECHSELCSIDGKTLGELLKVAQKHIEERHQ